MGQMLCQQKAVVLAHKASQGLFECLSLQAQLALG
jgi:hypothetical protein